MKADPVPPETIRLHFPSTLAEVDIACNEAQLFLSSRSKRCDLFLILLALREALTNAVLHGNRGNPEKHVECVISLGKKELVMTIRDQGNGFNWQTRKLELPAPESESGRGLAIINSSFDQIEFNEPGNEITFRKNLDPREEVCMYEIVREGSNTTVVIKEDLIGSRIEEIRNLLSGLVEEGVSTLTINLAGVQTIDSLGMGMLVATHNSLKLRHANLLLVNVEPKIHQVLTIMRLDKHFSISKAQ